MERIKKGLGRGLSSLIGETKVEYQKNQLPVSDLVPNKYQPRKIFDEDNLNDLTNSIKERGMIQPIIARKLNDDKSKFEIIAGERRWLAAQRAGLHNVPVVITDADDLKSLEFAIVENVQRHDLNPLEEAQGYRDQVIARSDGEAQRFEKLLAEYKRAPKVTRDRLYLEALEKVFRNSSKVMVDVEGGNNMMYLPLDKLAQRGQDESISPEAIRAAADEIRRELLSSNRGGSNRSRNN